MREGPTSTTASGSGRAWTLTVVVCLIVVVILSVTVAIATNMTWSGRMLTILVWMAIFIGGALALEKWVFPRMSEEGRGRGR